MNPWNYLSISVFLFGTVSVLTLPSVPRAEDSVQMDASTQEALAKTQQLLRDPQQRAQAIAGSAQAQTTDHQIQSLAGSPENANAIYELSAEMLSSMAQQAGGDPEKMKALAEQARKDPSGFAQKMTPEQQAKLREIVGRIPAGTPATGPYRN